LWSITPSFYEHKAICPVALDRLIAKLTLTLDDEEAEELDEPISEKELLGTGGLPEREVTGH
jgi:hypothetical protein